MSMLFSRWNAPNDRVAIGVAETSAHSGKPIFGAFCQITFDATAVGAVAGLTYDAANHLTTSLLFNNVSGANIEDLWGFTYAYQFICPDGSSSSVAEGAAALKTGKLRIDFVEASQFFRLSLVGNTGAIDNLVPGQEQELVSGIANSLASLRFSGLLLGS